MATAVGVAAQRLPVWDAGLVRLIAVEHGRIDAALKNPSWSSADSDMAAKSCLQVFATMAPNVLAPAFNVLCTMATAGALTNASTVTQRLLSILDGKPTLTGRQVCAAQILLMIEDLSPQAYEHVFTCVRRAGRLGRMDFRDLLAHPQATAAHWALWYGSPAVAERQAGGSIDGVLCRVAVVAGLRRDPMKREQIFNQLRQQVLTAWEGSQVFLLFATDPELALSLTDEDIEMLYRQCGGESMISTMMYLHPDSLSTLTPRVRAYVVLKNPELVAGPATDVAQGAPRAGHAVPGIRR